MGERAGGIARRQRPCRRRGAAPRPRPAADRPGCPRRRSAPPATRDLGDGARVPHEPGRRIQGQQEGGGVHAPRDRHREDGSRRSARPPRRRATGLDRMRWRPRPAAGPSTGTAHRKPSDRASRAERPERRRDRPPTLGPDGQPGSAERHGHGAVPIGPEDACPRRGQSIERRSCRVAVRVARPRRGDRDPWPDGIDERLRRGRPAAVVRDLEEVEPRQAVGEERRVDLLLDVPRQQEPVVADGAQHDHRHVVDPRPAVRRHGRHLAADRPQDPRSMSSTSSRSPAARPSRMGAPVVVRRESQAA